MHGRPKALCSGGLRIFCLGGLTAGNFLFGGAKGEFEGYITVTWYESPVNVMQ